MKRRARTNSQVPAKGRLRDMADALWSLAVRDDWDNRCAVCGSRKCEAHHLVPRQNEATRYDLRNGIALCAKHHKFDKHISPHLNAAGWLEWLETHYPRIEEWYFDNHRASFHGLRNADYYCRVICKLREHVDASEFERVVGIRFASWLRNSNVSTC